MNKHTFDKDELVEEVKKESKLGKLITKAHIDNIRSFRKQVVEGDG